MPRGFLSSATGGGRCWGSQASSLFLKTAVWEAGPSHPPRTAPCPISPAVPPGELAKRHMSSTIKCRALTMYHVGEGSFRVKDGKPLKFILCFSPKDERDLQTVNFRCS